MLSAANAKLGPGIFGFGLPSRGTCPGRTGLCSRLCYSFRYEMLRPTVRAFYRANLQAAKRPDFAAVVEAEIRAKQCRVVRVHTAGDFFSPAYAWAWHRVARRNPGVTFFAYTRSWRRPGFRPVLRALAARPNVHLWWSVDPETGMPGRPPPRGVRLAYLQAAAADRPAGPVDLVFRAHALRRTPRRVVAGAPVCPTETGYPDAAEATCGTCRTCLSPPPAPGRRPLPVVD